MGDGGGETRQKDAQIEETRKHRCIHYYVWSYFHFFSFNITRFLITFTCMIEVKLKLTPPSFIYAVKQLKQDYNTNIIAKDR